MIRARLVGDAKISAEKRSAEFSAAAIGRR
jgi:hypothetical protein